MRRLLAIVLLAMLPLQFVWASVASYCEHESPGAGCSGHHEHQYGADGLVPAVDAANQNDEAAGAMDLDCGHCHCQCGGLLILPANLPATLSAAPPNASSDAAGGAHAPPRPERPQWLRFA